MEYDIVDKLFSTEEKAKEVLILVVMEYDIVEPKDDEDREKSSLS